ncbi:MAG: hypothetical protein C5B47_01675 [Verrucomicrobia bacterium]|nr:MAG: hypothetical protein C5B47_01675 [Verrucomicrobiota bacterium]
MVSICPRSLLSICCLLISLSTLVAAPASERSSLQPSPDEQPLISSDQQLNKKETEQFLVRLAQARKQAGDTEVSFREKRFFPFMDKPIETTGTLAFHPPNSFRRNVNQGSLTVSNGKTLWIYEPTLYQVEIYDLAQTPFLKDTLTTLTAALSADQLSTLFHCTVSRNKNENVTLTLIPRTALRKVASKVVLVLRPNFSAAQLEIYSPEGDRTFTTFGVESHTRFSPATFEFRSPPNTRVSRPLAK